MKHRVLNPAFVGALAALAVVLVAGTSHAEDDVAKLWSKHCQTCHGADGKGKTKAGEKAGVKDLTDPAVKAELTKQKALDSMKNGVKAKDSDKLVMKSFSEKLSAEEMEKLAEHSLSFK